jgi:S-layer protein (TIGR01567 family)
MMDNTKKRFIIFLLVFIVGTLAGIVGYSNAKITTFEECEKAGWLVRSITVHDGFSSIEKECVLWSGKNFAKQRESSEPIFGDDTEINKSCSVDSDCKLPGSYAKRSDCPYEMKCIDYKCTVICPWLEKSSTPFFPTQKEPATIYMQALLGADNSEELILKDGCLRAGGFLLVWPYGFSYSADNGTFQVIDSTGKIVARVGDKIKVGGGADETRDGRVARGYSAQLPSERCSGPYYIVGEGITVDKSTSSVTATPTMKSAPLQHFLGQAFDEVAGNLTKKWDAENFAGFWRDSETGASTETLVINQSILNGGYRIIEKHNLIYTTKPVPLKYLVYARANVTPPGTDGSYSAVGWQGERYVLLDKNRLARVIFEQNASDVKIITTGYLWAFQEGYKLLAHSIEAPLEREAWIEFLNGTNKLDEQVLPDRYLYIYPSGASEIPIFITYISSIHRSPYEDVGEFKYTWLRSQNITDIREGKIFGAMEVISVKNGTIELRNKNPVVLSPGNTVHLMGDISIQVGSSETGLVFYPLKGGI